METTKGRIGKRKRKNKRLKGKMEKKRKIKGKNEKEVKERKDGMQVRKREEKMSKEGEKEVGG